MEWYRDKIIPFDNETVDFVRYKIYATLVVEFLKLLLVALLFPKIAYTVEKNMESKLSTTLQAIGYLKQQVQNHSASFTAVEERFKSSKW